MIGWFPSFYPDELVYSLLARYAVHAGYSGYLTAVEDLFLQKWINPSIDYINTLTPEARKMLCWQMPMENIIQQHTMYPCYVRFQKSEKRKQIMGEVMAGKGNYHLTGPFERRSSGKKRYLRYCPLCAQEDRERYGETYWHRGHQIPGIPLCPIHFCRLYDSTLQISDRPHHGLTTAEELCIETEAVVSVDPVKRKLSVYMCKVLKAEVPGVDLQVGQVLRSHLISTPYVSSRGLKRDRVALRLDFNLYYKLKEGIDDPEIWMLDKIFAGTRVQFSEVCMMAVYLDIPVEHLTEPVAHTDTDSAANCDDKIRKLHHQGMKYTEIAKTVGLSYDYAKLIGEGKKAGKHLRKHNQQSRYSGRNWIQYDRDILPQVKAVIQEIQSVKGRPKRVTIAAVARALHVPVSRFKQMPLCAAEVRKHQESQEQYWAREIVWAAEQIQVKGERWCWTSIRRLTNMRRVDFETCFPYLSNYADTDWTEKLRMLLPEPASTKNKHEV